MARSIAPEIHKSAFLEQTNKYITKIGEREYLTKGDPELTIPAFTDRVSDAAYPEALSGKVIQCVDIVVFDPATERVLIGRRNQEPHSGDWVIGGAMKAGQTVVEAARKNLGRELKMEVDPENFSEIGNYKFIWDSRAQPSTLNENSEEVVSCHMASTLEAYPVDEASIDLNKFNEEYAEIKWVNILDIVDAPEGAYHPCLVDMVSDLLEKQTTPEPATTKQEAINRHLAAIAYIQTHGPMK